MFSCEDSELHKNISSPPGRIPIRKLSTSRSNAILPLYCSAIYWIGVRIVVEASLSKEILLVRKPTTTFDPSIQDRALINDQITPEPLNSSLCHRASQPSPCRLCWTTLPAPPSTAPPAQSRSPPPTTPILPSQSMSTHELSHSAIA